MDVTTTLSCAAARAGLEPASSRLTVGRSTIELPCKNQHRTRQAYDVGGGLGWTRTSDGEIKNLLLYQLSYQSQRPTEVGQGVRTPR